MITLLTKEVILNSSPVFTINDETMIVDGTGIITENQTSQYKNSVLKNLTIK